MKTLFGSKQIDPVFYDKGNNSIRTLANSRDIPELIEEIVSPKIIDPIPNNKNDLNHDNNSFSFERKKLMELGQEGAKKYFVEGLVTDIDKTDPRIHCINNYNKSQMEIELDKIKKCSSCLKSLCTFLIFWASFEIVFSMGIIFVMAFNSIIDITFGIIPLIVNIAASIWMIYISLKGIVAAGNYEEIKRFLKFSILSLIFFAIQFTIMPLINSIPHLLREIFNYFNSTDEEELDALIGFAYVTVWFASMINTICCSFYVGITFGLKKLLMLKELHELEQKTLPLGYQLYAKLTPEVKDNTQNEIN